MAQNLIRIKQLEQSELTGLMQDVIDSNQYQITYGGTGINISDIAKINLSGAELNITNVPVNFASGSISLTGVTLSLINSPITTDLNVSGNLTVAGTIKYNEIIDITTTGNISGYTGYFQGLYANNLVYNTGDQIISGLKTFANNILISGTGIFNNVDLNNINDLTISGVNIVITGGNVNASQVFSPNLVYNTGDQSITGVKTFNSKIITPNLADQFPASSGVRRYYPNGALSFNTAASQSGIITYHPFLIKKDISNPILAVEISTFTVNTPIRVGIYSGANFGFQGARLFWSGSVANSASSAGIYRTTANTFLPKGPYIVASCNTGTASPASIFRIVAVNEFKSYFGEATGTTIFNFGSTLSTSLIYETGSDLKEFIGSGTYSSPASILFGPAVALEY